MSQSFVWPIVRGKAGKLVEFGVKLDISIVDGWTRLEYYGNTAQKGVQRSRKYGKMGI